MPIYLPKVQKTVFTTKKTDFGIMLEGFWLQNGVRIDLRGSGGASYIQVGPRGSDFRGPGALKPQFQAPNPPKLFLFFLKKMFV